MTDPDRIKCSFCGKTSAEVGRILAGPSVAVCDECIVLSAEIAGDGRSDWCDSLITRITAVRDKGK
jgi:ATP-dependent Clp protease ATP-binding subunit ClpX